MGVGVVCRSCKGYFLLRNIKIHSPPTCSIKDVASRWLFDFLIHRMNVFFFTASVTSLRDILS